jgi:hypothetical protein
MYHLNMVKNRRNDMNVKEKKLVLVCGSYFLARQTGLRDRLTVIGQTTETGDEMVAAGRTFMKEHKAAFGDVVLFTNNDHFLNGVRLAVKDGTLHQDDVEILFYDAQSVNNPVRLAINKDGRIEPGWPPRFFTAIEDALAQLS